MAKRGQPPTSNLVKLVRGNPGKRAICAEPQPAGKPVKPAAISLRAGELWDEVAAACPWLRQPDGYKLHVWCELQAEFEAAPSEMMSFRLTQLRALGSELGLDPVSRARIKTGEVPQQGSDIAAKYFSH